MGKAIMGVVIGAGIIFAIVAYFSQIAWPQAYANIEDPDTGIFELFPHRDVVAGNYILHHRQLRQLRMRAGRDGRCFTYPVRNGA